MSKKSIGIEKETYVYDGDYIKVKEKSGWQYVVEPDCVIAVPHLVDYDEVLVRKEFVPPFQEKHPEQEFFLTMISGTMEDGETPVDTLIRELQEEAGVLLNTTYMNYERWGEFFSNKGNSSKYHIFYLPLGINDFQKIKATGDGSKTEEISKTVRVNTKYVESLVPSDLISAFCLEKLKGKL
jgi:8-oxo-dGTP pyrophosphatase MutT (NUDIX family)